MSELIQKHDNRATIRWKLLTGVSALALSAYISSTALAKAEDADRPTVWIELGGQMEQLQGLSSPFTAPFMTAITPTPDVYGRNIFLAGQKPPRFAFGGEGEISFQPEDSDWIFSAAIRYGRSHSNSYMHNQGPRATAHKYNKHTHQYLTAPVDMYAAPIAEETGRIDEHHAIIDFQAGKDVGLGMLGSLGTSTVSAGVRFVQFAEKSAVDAYGRPEIGHGFRTFGIFLRPEPTFYNYTMHARSARSFKGVGPSLSWNASAALAGNKQDGELTLDWGINAALLFGRQKAKVDHTTKAYHLTQSKCYYSSYGYCYQYESGYPQVYSHNHHNVRSKRVTVSNIGGFVGLSMKYTNAKLSIGYRYDTFLNAMDIGIDAAKKSNVTFNGPYASISVGLGD